jgi:signal transduction histidine kinase/CheY-like chemotaxis protein
LPIFSAVRRSLRTKVVVIVLVTTFIALSVATALMLTNEVDYYRNFLLADATTQADLLARMSAPALQFDDPKAAGTNLELLNNRPSIRAAAIYAADGTIFATFSRPDSPAFPPLGPEGVQISGRTLTMFQPIVQNDEVLGTVYLESKYDLADRVRDYVMILGGVMLGGMLVAGFVALWLARSVTRPVADITEVARAVIASRDFTLRANRTTEDEIGVLVVAFNTMLAEVGQRAAALEETNRALLKETDERRDAEAALRVADQRKDEFLATLAHELRNPLAPMVNAIDLLQTPNRDISLTRTAQDMIARQLRHLVRLVDDLLDVSRITSGKLAVRKQVMDLAVVVHSAVDTVRPLFERGGQTLELDLPAQPVYLHADPVRLAQVFGNLLNNAAKFSEPRGRVTLSATVVGSRVRVEVRDEGVGMSADTLPRIFDMFVQADSSVARLHSGLGVGLALAKRLVELHDGSITVESQGMNRGSVFTVMLPVMAALASDRGDVAASPPSKQEPCRILLVDDNADFATSLALLLETLGHDVSVAHDASEALAIAHERAPDFAFLDLGLPRVSGYELARKLRANPATDRTVLIALSGWGQQQDRERSKEAGFALHLVKPIELQGIEAALRTLAEGH